MRARCEGLALLLCGVAAWLVLAAGPVQSAPPVPSSAKASPSAAAHATKPAAKKAAKPLTKADNGACYVCHLELQKEELTTVHLRENIGCADCHGTSNEHMHDEMLMTKPDVVFGRLEVAPLCAKCHEKPHEERQPQLKAFLDQWRGRDRPNGRAVHERSICTDCHGTHNIVKNLGAKRKSEDRVDWSSLFDGKSLAGWRCSNPAAWTVRQGRLLGTPPAAAPGEDLWSDAEYESYRLSLTFRVDRPLRAALLLRAGESDRGSRVEILDIDNPPAATGSVFVPGGRLALANLREDLFDREGWNTLSVEVRGDRVQVWLGGEEIGAARIAGPAKGRIGLHLDGGRAFQHGQLVVREVLVHRLADAPAK
jgi:hypothetical protein